MAGERALPGLGLFGFWAEGSNEWKAQMDSNMLILSALVQGAVETRTVALPGAPANGSIYLVPPADATNPNKVAIRDNGAWVYLTPKEGWRVYVRAEDGIATFDGADWNMAVEGGGSGGPVLEEIVPKAVDYTFVLADAEKYFRFDASATNLTATIPAASAENFPIGTTIKLRRAGSGSLVIAAAVGVTINTPETLTLRKQHSTAAVVKVAVNEWDLTGDLELSA